jgi:hypothetical protein
MRTRPAAPEPADLAAEANGLSVGLGTLTIMFFPFALPGLLLALPLVLAAVPLALVAAVLFVVGRGLLLALRLGRILVLVRSRRTRSTQRFTRPREAVGGPPGSP